MVKYLNAEIYKLTHRKTYLFGFFAFILGGIAAFMVLCKYNAGNGASLNFFLMNLPPLFMTGMFLVLMVSDMVFSDQYKFNTLKNEASYGLPRTRIYLGKLLAQTLLSIAYLVIMMAFFIGLCAVVLPMEEGSFYSAPDALIIVGYFLAAGLPLWVGAQAACCMCVFLVNGEMAASFLHLGLVFGLEAIVDLSGLLIGGQVGSALLKAVPYFPVRMLDGAQCVVGDMGYLGKAWLVGAFWVVVCTAAGLYGFCRKEIK